MKIDINDGRCRLGDVEGTPLITGINSHPNAVYIVLDNHQHNEGFQLNVLGNKTMLVNIRTGAIRAVDKDCRVTLLHKVAVSADVFSRDDTYNKDC